MHRGQLLLKRPNSSQDLEIAVVIIVSRYPLSAFSFACLNTCHFLHKFHLKYFGRLGSSIYPFRTMGCKTAYFISILTTQPATHACSRLEYLSISALRGADLPY